MSLEFINYTSIDSFYKTMSELASMNSKYRAEIFENMSISEIDMMLDSLNNRETKLINESSYGAWFNDPTFMQIKLLQDGLSALREHIEELKETETLIPGFTYYKNVKQFGPIVEGQYCLYQGKNHPVNWISFRDNLPSMKVMEVLKHGDINDFTKLYVEMANGRPDSLDNLSLEHIRESSDDALYLMENYCDTKWDGVWAWEMKAPYILGDIIEESKDMRNMTLLEMHDILKSMIVEMDESGADKFQVISYVKELSDSIDGMIDKFSKLAGETLISFKSQVLTSFGNEAAMKVENAINGPINVVADSLSRLKSNVDTLVGDLENHQPSEFEDMNGGMAPPPVDNEGGEEMMPPEGEEGMSMGGEEGGLPPVNPPERAKKMA